MLNTFEPSSILLSIGPIAIHWYGFIIALGALLGYIAVMHIAKQFNIDRKQLGDLIFYCIVFGIIGARLYHVIGQFSFYVGHPLEIFAIWNGGLAIHGGLIGGILVVLYMSKKYSLNKWRIADLLSVGVILGQAVGRWGNFFNQELYGRPTDLPWKISISLENRLSEYIDAQFYHPTFLYESLLNGLLFAVLFWLLKKNKLPEGSIVLLYLIGYSLIRFAMEFLRFEPTVFVFGFRFPQVLSVVVIFGAGYLLVKKLHKVKNNKT